jgi:hypothetical protein
MIASLFSIMTTTIHFVAGRRTAAIIVGSRWTAVVPAAISIVVARRARPIKVVSRRRTAPAVVIA